MSLTMTTPSVIDLTRVLPWRVEARASLRTTRLLTPDDQKAYADRIRTDHTMRIFGFRNGEHLVALGGLEGIDYVNGHAEISLIVKPRATGKGIGREAVALILEEAFDRLDLRTVWGECYHSTDAWKFWRKIAEQYGCDDLTVTWPRRKYWGGVLYDADLFTITVERWRAPVGPSATHVDLRIKGA